MSVARCIGNNMIAYIYPHQYALPIQHVPYAGCLVLRDIDIVVRRALNAPIFEA